MKKVAKGLFLKIAVLTATLLLFVAAGVLAACGGSAKHTLKFNAGEGIEIPDIVAKAGETITPPEDPEKTGFEFEGWYLEENGTGEKQSLPSVMPDEDRTYYGKWEQLPAIALDLDGGSLTGADALYLKAGSDLYTFMKTFVPTKDGHKFFAWAMNGSPLAENAKMPEGGVTLTALWQIPYTVKTYTLDFAAFNAETEDYDIYLEGETQTGYALPGTQVDGSDVVPEHYTLNTEKTVPMSVTEGEENLLSVYLDPKYTLYTDVFESTDFLYELETEEGTLYLDRIGMEGRKKSTAYDKDTGLFSFQTDKEDFAIEGKIAGENFYYFRDTIEQTFADYFDSEATLKIEDGQKVIYTPEEGDPVTGVYTVDVERGVYVVTPAAGDPFEFVLIEVSGVLYFRLNDNITGSYAYDGEFEDGGWFYFRFDGFGVAEYYDSDYPDEPLEYEYVLQANGIINVLDLGLIKLQEGEKTLEGGPTVDGTFILSDGYEGEYVHVNGGRRETLTLDGFGGASFAVYKNDVLDPNEGTTGTYTVESDEKFLIDGYDPYYGIPMVGPYSGVNEWLNYTAQNKTTKYLFENAQNGDGTTSLTFKPWSDSDFDVAPGAHAVTNDFTYKGTVHKVDSTHKAFLYFCLDETVDLWYGEYDAEYEDFVYTLVVYGDWYLDWEGIGELYNYDLDYDGMYFGEMAEDGSFAFTEETWDGEPEQYVFYEGDEGKLYVDVFGDAYFQAAEGDPKAVTYKQTTLGLVEVFVFTGLPANVPTQYAVYYDDYEIDPVGDYTVYPIDGTKNKLLEIAYPDGTEGGDVVLLLTPDKAYLGLLWYPTDDDVVVEYLFAGDVTAVEGSQNEFTFTWDDAIYYDELDYLTDDDYYYAAMFTDFQYKVVGNTFYYFDGAVYDLTNGADKLVTDGYGSATLTQGGKAVEGFYEAQYDVVEFYNEELDLLFAIDGEKNTFKPIDTDAPGANLLGYYLGATADENGDPEYLTDAGIFLDGAGTFIYEEIVEGDDGEELVTKNGTYEILNITGGVIELTFEDGDVWEASIVGAYILFRNNALMGSYDAYTDDGVELGRLTGGNGYYEEGATFVGEDVNGVFDYEGYMARGFIEDLYADSTPQFRDDPEGDVVVFVTYVDGEQKQYVFDIDSAAEEGEIAKVYYRDKFYGTVAEYKTVGGMTGNYLYLDGHSKATLFTLDGDERETVAEGTYAFAEGFEDAYTFKSTGQNFIFEATGISYGGGVLYIYTVYGEDEDLLLINDDWSILYMDGFGNATYVDAYGAVSSGEYYKVIEGEQIYCINVEGSTQRIFYEIDTANETFALCEGEYIVRGDVLYMYFGTGESFRVPDGVHTIATGAFKLDGTHNLTSIDFNEVTTIQAKALWNLPQIKSLTGNIEYIGDSAFENVKTLETIDLPKLKTIGARAFYGCDALVEVKLAAIESIGENAFSRSTAWSDTKPLTLDLTAVTDFAKFTIAEDAFRAYKGANGFVDETVFVKGSAILIGGTTATMDAAVKLLKSAKYGLASLITFVLEDKSNAQIYFRAIVTVNDAGKITVDKAFVNMDPSAADSEYTELRLSETETGSGIYQASVGSNLVLQVTVSLAEGTTEKIPAVKGEIFGYQFSTYSPVSCSITLQIEGGKIKNVIACEESYNDVTPENVVISDDGLTVTFETATSKFKVTITAQGNGYEGEIVALEYAANAYSDDYKYSATVKLNAEGSEKKIVSVSEFKISYEVVAITSQVANDDGSVTITVDGGTKYKLSMGVDDWGYDILVVEEAQ